MIEFVSDISSLETSEMTDSQAIEYKELIDYYEIAGPDYAYWSREFNMHFGYFRWGMNPFCLEKMLNQMNQEVYNRLQILPLPKAKVLDLGCGLGATARYFAHQNPHLTINGVSLVPWQIEQGKILTQKAGLTDQVSLQQADYTRLPFANASFDYVYALESSCYAQGWDKADLLQEIRRVLKPQGRFVIADGFLKTTRLPFGLRSIYRQVCKAWALENFGEIKAFQNKLQDLGFKDLIIKDISWHIAPSVAYIPYTTFKFLWYEAGKMGRLARQRRNNVIAPILGMLLGLARPYFAYYMIEGRA
ncbi:MAG: methyltransferase domain-containing protein [Microscillaceae bacterium]|jgi:ubiquinone/menaquinone biosynthesis C-methylase UbiE|nr:methyltransferase domain-containing protein [Microscillaceae bacterium]